MESGSLPSHTDIRLQMTGCGRRCYECDTELFACQGHDSTWCMRAQGLHQVGKTFVCFQCCEDSQWAWWNRMQRANDWQHVTCDHKWLKQRSLNNLTPPPSSQDNSQLLTDIRDASRRSTARQSQPILQAVPPPPPPPTPSLADIASHLDNLEDKIEACMANIDVIKGFLIALDAKIDAIQAMMIQWNQW